jgi:hypothetical protein
MLGIAVGGPPVPGIRLSASTAKDARPGSRAGSLGRADNSSRIDVSRGSNGCGSVTRQASATGTGSAPDSGR